MSKNLYLLFDTIIKNTCKFFQIITGILKIWQVWYPFQCKWSIIYKFFWSEVMIILNYDKYHLYYDYRIMTTSRSCEIYHGYWLVMSITSRILSHSLSLVPSLSHSIFSRSINFIYQQLKLGNYVDQAQLQLKCFNLICF